MVKKNVILMWGQRLTRRGKGILDLQPLRGRTGVDRFNESGVNQIFLFVHFHTKEPGAMVQEIG